MTPVTHYLITNRQIDRVDGQETIHRSGKEQAVDNAQISFRFARYTFNADDLNTEGTVELVSDLLPSDSTVGTYSNFCGLCSRTPERPRPQPTGYGGLNRF